MKNKFSQDTITMPPSTLLKEPQNLSASQSAFEKAVFGNQKVIHSVFENQACRPARIATKDGNSELTYQELNDRSNRLAHYLKKRGVKQETPVVLYLDRTNEMVVAILAVLKAGGAYLPIDLAYPKDRVAFMIEDSKAPLVITEEQFLANLPEMAGDVVCVDKQRAAIAQESAENLECTVQPENAAYIIYTSGSTGKPKGVVVTHRNVVRLFEATHEWYQFSNKDAWTLFHSFAFDFSVWELWGALLYGGKLVVVPYMVSRSPEKFYELLATEKITVLNQTPSAFRQLIRAEQSSPQVEALSLRYVIFGGEALELQSLKTWFDRHGDEQPQLINMYGITETTVHVTYRPIKKKDLETGLGSVIGEAIPDLTIHLLDENQRPVPVGVPGEIYVGGAGVARGYLNRPDLNAEKFITSPLTDDPEDRLYRSGDLAQYTAAGELEYLGRIDHQVKIRGFRIELGEIETALNRHPSIHESAVVAREDSTGEKRLVAYLVCRSHAPAISDLRNFIGEKLPQYMVPAQFVFLDVFPLTINGKIDRKALPSPEQVRPETGKNFVAPSTPEEKTLAGVWAKALLVDKVGVHDNFFELGGDSIRSIQVLAQAQSKGIKFSLEKLFQHPTVYEIVRDLDARDHDSISEDAPFSLVSEVDRKNFPAGIEDAYPAAKLQTGMIFHSDYDLKSAIFHDVFSFRLTIPFALDTLENAIQRLADRHPIYRTSFDLTSFSEPMQLIHQNVKVPLSIEDLRGSKAADQKNALINWVETEKRTPFIWSVPPMMRLHVQRQTDETFQFIVSFHHVIMDGWSLAAMLTELFQDYDALLRKTGQEIQAPRVTYRDFVRMERETINDEVARKFWTRKLENPTTHQIPRWPTEFCKGGHEQVRGPEISFDPAIFENLKRLANSAGVPIRTVLLAAHTKVMSALTGQTDIITGLVANGRPQTIDGEKLLGLFLNTLPFRSQLNGGTWKELVQQTFKAEQEILPHRRAPLAEIQQWSGGKALFETAFDFVQFHVYKDLPGYKDHSFLEDYYFEANNFTFFTTFMVDATAAQLQMHFDYDPNVLCEPQIKAICEYYSNTLAAMAEDASQHYEAYMPLPKEERQRQLIEWNQTELPISEKCVHQLFEEQVERTPEAVAAIFENETITYRELNERANVIASRLQALGVGPEVFVGVYQERSLAMLASVLGVLKAGGAYVPLDPTYPRERIAFMMEDARMPLILTQEKFHAQMDSETTKALAVEKLLAEIPTGEVAANPSVTPLNLAYMIYTSGSTGKPKGVQIPHRAVVSFLASMKNEPGLAPDDVLLAVTTLSFDIAGLELLLPLVVGAKIVIAKSEQTVDPNALARLMENHGVTVMQATPTTWRMLLESGWRGRKNLKALCGGEAMPRELGNKLLEHCGSVWNMYGPTETTIWSCVEKMESGNGPVPIGRPIANTEIYLLDSYLQPVPIGSEGELYIGGTGLARGYFKREELTREKFIPHPFNKDPNTRLYRTGDLARYLPDGKIVCVGRTDHQVKIRGFRIELGEIESALTQHPAIAAAVVVADEGDSDKRLVGYWVARDGLKPSLTELRQFVEQRLPFYMCPSLFMELPEFPLTPNGKIDRKRLPKPPQERPQLQEQFVEPRTPFEVEVAATWREVLKIEKIGVHDNFFTLGGHSLLAMQAIVRLREKLDVALTINSLFRYPTTEQFALFLLDEIVNQQNVTDL